MKIDLALLENIIALPKIQRVELRHVFDDLGLEVEGVEDDNNKTIFNIETLAHRGDHLCALGIAREFSGRYLTAIKHPALLEELPKSPTQTPLQVNTEFCFAYSLLELKYSSNTKLNASIRNFIDLSSDQPDIVKLSNYVLSEIGQPTHAFDAKKIVGSIRVELSSQPEEIVALDNKTYQVPANSILIKDQEKTIAVAGVIGCANSMVTAETSHVLIESAAFCPTHVRKTARAMGISTDASYLFERGSDLSATDVALRRIALLLEGSELLGLSSYKNLPEFPIFPVELAKFKWHLNQPNLSVANVQQKLLALGYCVEINGELLICAIPSHRFWNIKTEACIIEDYCRAVGFNSITPVIPTPVIHDVANHPNETLVAAFEPILTSLGFSEVITRSYYSNEEVNLIAELDSNLAEQHVKIINSLEGAYSNLKLTNLIHLSKVIQRSLRFNLPSVKVYEFGRIFNKSGFKTSPYQYEKDFLTLAFAGRWFNHNWKKPQSLLDSLANTSGVIQSLLEKLKIDFQVLPGTNPLLHPGRQAKFVAKGETLATFGTIHPLLKDRLGLKEDLIFGEVLLDECYQQRKIKADYQIIDFPPIKWDLTFKVPSRMPASQVLQLIHTIKPNFLRSVEIIDSFKKPEEDYSRISYRFFFQIAERTLSNEEVDQVVANLLATLKTQHQLEIVS